MAYSMWLPKQTLHEMREIKRCVTLAARGKPYRFEEYRNLKRADPIAHVQADTLATLKGALSDLLASHWTLIRRMLAEHCGTVARESLAALPGWRAGMEVEHTRMISECEMLERAA